MQLVLGGGCTLTALPEAQLTSGSRPDASALRDRSAQDSPGHDMDPADRATRDTSPGADRASQDRAAMDGDGTDLELEDRSSADLTVADAPAEDQTGADAGARDTGAEDGSPAEGPVLDAALNDASVADTALPDLAPVDAGDIADCPDQATLEDLLRCVLAHLPEQYSDSYTVPTTEQHAAWRQAATEMLVGGCGASLPAALGGAVRRYSFTDGDNGRAYCVLEEHADADGDGTLDHGWGAFIVDPAATRTLHHQAPRPLQDSGTELEALSLFKRTRSRSFALAGAHPAASSAGSSCQAGHLASAASHNADSMLQAATEALRTYHGSGTFVVLQWLGLEPEVCNGDVVISYGFDLRPDSATDAARLKDSLLLAHPLWSVKLAGSSNCTELEGSNVQGRLLNDVPAAQVCDTAAAVSSMRFIAVLQDPGFRSPDDWGSALWAVWP